MVTKSKVRKVVKCESCKCTGYLIGYYKAPRNWYRFQIGLTKKYYYICNYCYNEYLRRMVLFEV